MQLTPLQEKWLQALESGDYQQTTGHLCAYQDADGITAEPGSDEEMSNPPNSFCCLGVACEIAENEMLIDRYDPRLNFPPEKVVEIFGFLPSHSRLSLGEQKGTSALARLNDIEGLTFPQIAAKVRQSPETYFVSETK